MNAAIPAPIILVVDDNAPALHETAALLRQAGYQIAEVGNGEDALELARDLRPALVLLDVVLPDITGLDVLRQIRGDQRLEGVSVVMFTAVDSTAGHHSDGDGSSAGADGYIARPVANAEILARVRSQLRQHDLAAKLKASEDLLRVSELRYRRLFESAKDGILILDANTGMVVDVNPFMISLLGYSHEKFLSMAIWELGFFRDIVANVSSFAELKAKGYARYDNLPLETFDGRHIAVEFVSNVYLVEAVEVIQCNIRDVTERKRADERLLLLGSAVEQSSESILITDAELDLPGPRILFVNPAFTAMTGYTAEEVLGKTPRILQGAKTDKAVLSRLRENLEQGHPFVGEAINYRKDGTEFHLEWRIAPIQDGSGETTHYVALQRDISERIATSEKIHQLNLDLERRVVDRTWELELANHELEAFSYSVSHDLRAPLRAVIGFSHAVVEDFGVMLPEGGKAQLQTILNAAQLMGTLIDDLLAFSRLSRAPLKKQAVNPGDIVRAVLNGLSAERVGRQIEVQIGELPVCSGDPNLLKQVWINLLSNAFKYTRNRETAVVEIGYEKDMEGGAYFVRDNGAGFDMRHAGRLFGVFQRLHRAEEYEGTGVGLAIVERVIHRHGGRVWAVAALDRGATFYFTLGTKAVP